MNLRCDWPSEESRTLDLQNASDMRHLLRDIEVAEELLIRYRDEMAGRRPRPVFGIQVRLAMGAKPDNQFAAMCSDRLDQAIVATHRITVPDIAAARPRLSDPGLDLPVTIPTALVFLVLARVGIRRLRTRFGDDEAIVRAVATIAASIGVGVAVVAFFAVWGAFAHIVYLGNEHVSFRGARIGFPARAPRLLLGAVVTFWALAARSHRGDVKGM